MRIAIRWDLCDNSTQCWFIKHCPQHVFEHNGETVEFHEDRCNGCLICKDHCNIVFVAQDDTEYDQCMYCLNQIESQDLSVDLFGTEPIHSEACIYYDGKEENNYQSTIELIKNTKQFQLIELLDNRSIVCKHKGQPFSVFQEDLKSLISQVYCGRILHRIIYTCDNTPIFQKFIDFFDADLLKHSAPLLILYFDGKVLAKYGHGHITCDNYNSHQIGMIEEIKKQLDIL